MASINLPRGDSDNFQELPKDKEPTPAITIDARILKATEEVLGNILIPRSINDPHPPVQATVPENPQRLEAFVTGDKAKSSPEQQAYVSAKSRFQKAAEALEKLTTSPAYTDESGALKDESYKTTPEYKEYKAAKQALMKARQPIQKETVGLAVQLIKAKAEYEQLAHQPPSSDRNALLALESAKQKYIQAAYDLNHNSYYKEMSANETAGRPEINNFKQAVQSADFNTFKRAVHNALHTPDEIKSKLVTIQGDYNKTLDLLAMYAKVAQRFIHQNPHPQPDDKYIFAYHTMLYELEKTTSILKQEHVELVEALNEIVPDQNLSLFTNFSFVSVRDAVPELASVKTRLKEMAAAPATSSNVEARVNPAGSASFTPEEMQIWEKVRSALTTDVENFKQVCIDLEIELSSLEHLESVDRNNADQMSILNERIKVVNEIFEDMPEEKEKLTSDVEQYNQQTPLMSVRNDIPELELMKLKIGNLNRLRDNFVTPFLFDHTYRSITSNVSSYVKSRGIKELNDETLKRFPRQDLINFLDYLEISQKDLRNDFGDNPDLEEKFLPFHSWLNNLINPLRSYLEKTTRGQSL